AHRGTVNALAFAPDGATLASGGGDHRVRLWTTEGVDRLPDEGNAGPMACVACSPDGRFLVSAGPDASVHIWDPTGRRLRRILGPEPSVAAMAFTAGGTLLAVGGLDGTVQLLDLTRGIAVARWQAHRGVVVSLVSSPDDQTLATGGNDGMIRIWDRA